MTTTASSTHRAISVPADVTKLTAQFNLPEQFTLAPGGTYYFDLSAMGIPGTVNDALPDKTMRYVPFTYAGTVDAYKLTSEMATTEEDAEQNQYPHSLFVADYAVTHTISWDDLNTANLIFGKNYASGGVDYTLRAPSVGSNATGLGDSDPGDAPKQRMGQDAEQGRADISKTGMKCIRGDRILLSIRRVGPCGSRVRFGPPLVLLQCFALLPVRRFPPRP
ncbi:MAG: hypothetical protein ACLU3I_14280 [Acutalibacteraceae bacterium]